MTHSMGRDVGSVLLVRGDLAAIGAAVGTSVGRGTNIAALTGGAVRANSVRVHVAVRGNLDSADTYVVDNIKLQSDTSSAFGAPVTRVTAADVTLTGTATDVDYFSDADMDLDLGQLPEAHVWLRVSCRHTISDTTNTNGVVVATLVFGGLAVA